MKAIDWDADLSDAERDELIEKLSAKIGKHRMQTPAILFLEMHKPFAFIASQTVILTSGFLAPFVGFENIQRYSKLIESRDNIERLIRRLETTSGSEPASGLPDKEHQQTLASSLPD